MITYIKVFLFIIASFLILSVWVLYLLFFPIDLNNKEKVFFNINYNQSASSIADSLYNQGLIRSKFIFYLYVRLFKYDKTFLAGQYELSYDMNIIDIVKKLSHGKPNYIKLTIPEGLNIYQIASLLESKNILKKTDFLSCIENCIFEYDFLENGKIKEGYLFPDTYFLTINKINARYIIEKMLDNFLNKINSLEIKNGKEILGKYRTLDEIINMASLIEEESFNNDEERYIISGILWKRFDENMRLDVDATVRYALNKITGDLTKNDLNIDSKYNTRKYKGFPPTPISNPGIDAIKAAIYPKITDYYYYLHDSNGNVHFSKTLDEHNKKVNKYINNN